MTTTHPAATEAHPSEEAMDRLVLVASSGELEKTWATLIIATTGAASGMQTTIFFTFWGLFPLVRDDAKITGENWMQKMVSVMNHGGGTEHLKLSKMNFAGAGPAMMKKLAKDHHVATPHELLELAVDLGVRLVPCQMTMDLMGLTKDDLIDGVDDPAGAAFMLAEARGATTFFI